MILLNRLTFSKENYVLISMGVDSTNKEGKKQVLEVYALAQLVQGKREIHLARLK